MHGGLSLFSRYGVTNLLGKLEEGNSRNLDVMLSLCFWIFAFNCFLPTSGSKTHETGIRAAFCVPEFNFYR